LQKLKKKIVKPVSKKAIKPVASKKVEKKDISISPATSKKLSVKNYLKNQPVNQLMPL